MVGFYFFLEDWLENCLEVGVCVFMVGCIVEEVRRWIVFMEVWVFKEKVNRKEG